VGLARCFNGVAWAICQIQLDFSRIISHVFVVLWVGAAASLEAERLRQAFETRAPLIIRSPTTGLGDIQIDTVCPNNYIHVT
jgi:hypothetical protein